MEGFNRPTNPKPARGSKFSQTLSRFKGIIRIPGRKPTPTVPNASQKPTIRETRGRTNPQAVNHPYSRASMTLKPYMSQPMLALQHRSSADTDCQQSHPSDPDSDMSSTSVEPSPARLNSDFALPMPGKRLYHDSRRHSRTLSMHSLSSPTLEDFGITPSPETVNDGRQEMKAEFPKAPGNGIDLQNDTPPSPTPPTPPPKSGRYHDSKENKRRAPSPPTPPPHLKQTSVIDRAAQNGVISFTKVLTSRPSKSKLRPFSQRQEEPLPPVPQTPSTAPAPPRKLSPPPIPVVQSKPTLEACSKRPGSITLSSSPAVPTRSTLSSAHKPSWSAHEPRAQLTMGLAPPPAPLARSSSETDGKALLIVNQTSNVETPTKEMRPVLTMPTSLNRRISLLAAAGGSARLSPSIMHRPPPLPILNLPKLPVTLSDDATGGASVSRRRSERVGLGSMPALPLQGTNRGVGGHEEVDDMEEDDEDDMDDIDEDDMEDENDEEQGPNTDDLEDTLLRTSTSTDSGSMLSDESLTGRGSYDLRRPLERPGGWQNNLRLELPPLFVHSPPDTRFQAPSTSGMVGYRSVNPLDRKGKQKQLAIPLASEILFPEMGSPFSRRLQPSVLVSPPNRPLWDAPSSTSSGGNDYFASRLTIPEPLSFSHSHFGGSDKTPLARSDPFAASSSSPLATPRALSSYESEARPWLPKAVNGGTNSNRNSLAFEESAASRLLAHRPSMYKRASRSLIDIHEIEKKEEVERMVREGEEEQERELRRRSTRRNNRNSVPLAAEGGTTDRNSTVKHDRLGTMPEEEILPKEEGEAMTVQTRSTGATETVLAGILASRDPLIEGGVQNGGVSALAAGIAGGSTASTSLETAAGGSLEMKKTQNRISMAPAYEASNPLPLRKRRSMPTFNETTAPPPYPSFAPHPYGLKPSLQILPREDEGREALPPYSNQISLKAIMPRKMEFTSPGVQAKDRKWKRVLCVLEGTMFRVYRCPVGSGGVSAIGQWWESKVGAGDVTAATSAGANRTNEAATATVPKPRDEEKLNQQYLGHPLHNEPRLASGSQTIMQPTSAPAVTPTSVYGAGDKGTQVAMTKSALNLAVQFLKPGSRHTRSNSDSGPPSPTTIGRQPGTPRSSLNLPRSGTSTPSSSTFAPSSSRSHSPLPSSPAHGSRSQSPMPSQSSSRLAIPLASGSIPSRPTTPTTGNSGRSSRFLSSAPKSARSDSSRKSDPHPNDMLRCYTMQNAESGLGNDYVKRKNVIRVRLEGEQFLLQAGDVPSVVQWIEGLQAATNVALDLDERPMPRGPIFPRRRRRRRPNVPAITTTGALARTSVVMETYTPTSATAGQPALRRE